MPWSIAVSSTSPEPSGSAQVDVGDTFVVGTGSERFSVRHIMTYYNIHVCTLPRLELIFPSTKGEGVI